LRARSSVSAGGDKRKKLAIIKTKYLIIGRQKITLYYA
jgi:hypothetical protein